MADLYADEYFAAAPPERIGGAIASQINRTLSRRKDTSDRGDFGQAYMHSYASISTAQGTGIKVTRGGEQGQLSKIRINTAASIEKSLLGLLLSAKMNWRPQAKTGDVADRAVIQKASNTLEWLWKIRRLNGTVTRFVDQGLRYGEAFVFAPWDLGIGPPAGVGGRAQGDINFHNVPPWHVFRDEAYRDFKQCPWVCVRMFESRWDFVAQNPMTVTGEDTRSMTGAATTSELSLIDDTQPVNDVCPVYYFFHRKTPAVPQGREVVFRNADCVVVDKPLSYGSIPIKRFAPDELDDTTSGYTTFFDVLAAQEVSDGIETSISSNILTFGTQSIALGEGTTHSARDAQGLRYFYVKPGGMEPKAVQMTAQPKEAFNHLDHLKGAQRDLMGLNDVAMGQPQTAQMNAEAFSILAGMAQQRNAPIQQKILDAVGEIGSHALETINARYSSARSLAIAGKDSKSFDVFQVGAGDLEKIDSVIVDVGSPLEQSVAGRTQLAMMLKDNGAVKSAEQLTQVMETGRLEPVTDPLRSAQLLVDMENEKLSSGEPVKPHYLDDHSFHAQMHKTVIDNPKARQSDEIHKTLMEHIDEHYCLFYGIEPVQPMPPPAPGMQAPPMPTMSQQARADIGYSLKMKMLLGQQVPQMGAPAPGMPPGDSPGNATADGLAALAPPTPGQPTAPQAPPGAPLPPQ